MTENKHSSASTVAIIALALSIAAQTAIFSFWLGGLNERVKTTEQGVQKLLDMHTIKQGEMKQ